MLAPVAGLLLDSINRCDVDIRREMYNGVVLSGGTSLFTGLRDRLEKDLFDLAPQGTKVKVTSPVNPTERRFSVWIGELADGSAFDHHSDSNSSSCWRPVKLSLSSPCLWQWFQYMCASVDVVITVN